MSHSSKAEKTCPHCGCPTTKPRSEADHRRFFAVIRIAYDQWPESHEFQPDSSEHLRAWLLCKAQYRDCVTIPVEGDHPAVARLAVLAAEGAIKAAGAHAFLRPHGSAIAVFSPKSIAWDTLGQREFAEVRSAVEDVIKAETGMDAETLLANKDKAA